MQNQNQNQKAGGGVAGGGAAAGDAVVVNNNNNNPINMKSYSFFAILLQLSDENAKKIEETLTIQRFFSLSSDELHDALKYDGVVAVSDIETIIGRRRMIMKEGKGWREFCEYLDRLRARGVKWDDGQLSLLLKPCRLEDEEEEILRLCLSMDDGASKPVPFTALDALCQIQPQSSSHSVELLCHILSRLVVTITVETMPDFFSKYVEKIWELLLGIVTRHQQQQKQQTQQQQKQLLSPSAARWHLTLLANLFYMLSETENKRDRRYELLQIISPGEHFDTGYFSKKNQKKRNFFDELLKIFLVPAGVVNTDLGACYLSLGFRNIITTAAGGRTEIRNFFVLNDEVKQVFLRSAQFVHSRLSCANHLRVLYEILHEQRVTTKHTTQVAEIWIRDSNVVTSMTRVASIAIYLDPTPFCAEVIFFNAYFLFPDENEQCHRLLSITENRDLVEILEHDIVKNHLSGRARLADFNYRLTAKLRAVLRFIEN